MTEIRPVIVALPPSEPVFTTKKGKVTVGLLGVVLWMNADTAESCVEFPPFGRAVVRNECLRPSALHSDIVKYLVDDVRQAAGDCEIAHEMEDRLHQFVLREIASNNCVNPQRAAEAALKTLEIDFPRYCA